MNLDGRLCLLCATTLLLWGVWGFFGKVAMNRGMQPIGMFTAEVAISALSVILLTLALVCGRGGSYAAPSWNIFGVLSGLALALGLLSYYFALQASPAAIIVPLTAGYPAITVLLSHALLNEKPTNSQWLGISLIVAGTVLLLSGQVHVLRK